MIKYSKYIIFCFFIYFSFSCKKENEIRQNSIKITEIYTKTITEHSEDLVNDYSDYDIFDAYILKNKSVLYTDNLLGGSDQNLYKFNFWNPYKEFSEDTYISASPLANSIPSTYKNLVYEMEDDLIVLNYPFNNNGRLNEFYVFENTFVKEHMEINKDVHYLNLYNNGYKVIERIGGNISFREYDEDLVQVISDKIINSDSITSLDELLPFIKVDNYYVVFEAIQQKIHVYNSQMDYLNTIYFENTLSPMNDVDYKSITFVNGSIFFKSVYQADYRSSVLHMFNPNSGHYFNKIFEYSEIAVRSIAPCSDGFILAGFINELGADIPIIDYYHVGEGLTPVVVVVNSNFEVINDIVIPVKSKFSFSPIIDLKVNNLNTFSLTFFAINQSFYQPYWVNFEYND